MTQQTPKNTASRLRELERLRSTGAQDLASAASQIEGMTPLEAENAERDNTFKLKRVIRKCKQGALWAVLVFGCAVLVAAFAALCVLLSVYISHVIETPEQVGELLSSVWGHVLAMGFALFIDRRLRD